MRKLTTLLAAAVLSAASAFGAAPGGAAKPVVSILGDSYSTYAGYITEGNEARVSVVCKGFVDGKP